MNTRDAQIIEMIEPGSSVLDLGCGDGSLLSLLRSKRQARVQGVELSEHMIRSCIRKGLPVIHADLNEGLQKHVTSSYDYVVLNRTLQVMRYPDALLQEMLRVGKKAIVNFLNFGFYRNRFQLMYRGIMPVNRVIPYEWYNTPNIHFCTKKDFHRLCRGLDIRIVGESFTRNKKKIPRVFPNLLATEICCLLEWKK